MPARLEHQTGPDPVIFSEKMGALLNHAGAGEDRPATADQAHRIAAGMAVNAEEAVPCHEDASPFGIHQSIAPDPLPSRPASRMARLR
ncbi:hypothetical protein RQ832_26325, partial [Roseomonas sp. DSM 102946]|nr:hypothetical protein [Roseomonas sp. DSM 102946]